MKVTAIHLLVIKLLGTIVLGFLLLLVPQNNIQFVLFGLLPLCIFCFLALQGNLKINLTKADLAMLGFLLSCFLSYLWAYNGSLIWTQAFGWLGLFCVMLAFRFLDKDYGIQSYLHVMFLYFFVIVMIHHLSAVRFGVEVISPDWSAFMAKNGNQTACYLLTLFPFLFYYSSTNAFVSFLKLTAIILLANLVIIVGAKWGLVALFLLVGYHFWVTNKNKLLAVSAVLIVLALLIYLIEIFVPGSFAFLPSPLDQPRVALIGLSMDVFSAHPLLGVGLGNWHTQAYATDLSALPSFNDPDAFVRHNSYNLFFQLLSEIGLLGTLCFLAFLVWSVGGLVRQKDKFTDFEKAGFAAFLTYLFCSYFYKGVNFNEYSFSGTELLAFVSLGVLSKRFAVTSIGIPRWLVILLSFSVTIWFSGTLLYWHQYNACQKSVSVDTQEETLEKLEALYHPVFRTKHNFQNSLELKLAEAHRAAGNIDQAQVYYEKMLIAEPYNCDLLISYADYLRSINTPAAKIEPYLNRVADIQPNSRVVQQRKELLSQ